MVTRIKQSKILVAFLVFSLVLTLFAPVAQAAENPRIRIPVTVEVTGTPPSVDEDYTIVLEADNPAYPMPAGSTDGTYRLIVTGADTVQLPEIIFTALGIYTYSIYQEPGDNDLAVYDDRVYDLVVYVTNAEDGSGLATTVILYLRGQQEKLDEVVFENYYEVPTTNITGSKTWIGGNPEDWYAVELELYRRTLADGPEELDAEYTTEKTADNLWVYTWKDLPVMNADGIAYVYYVKEPVVPENYTSSVEGLHVTNTFDQGTRDIEVMKTWVAGPSERPNVTIRLYADGVEVDRVLLVSPVTSHIFTGLPIYRPDGGEIEYTITEDEITGYLSEIDGFEAINTFMELPPTGTSNSLVLPFMGIMLTLAGVGMIRGKKKEQK